MSEPVTCVILAAGESRRFPGNKLLYPLRSGTLLERSIRACSEFPTVVVCSPAIKERIDSSVCIVVNDRPDLGMIRSLQLADDCVDRAHAIAVLPADLALIEPEHVRSVVQESAHVDVAYPRRSDGTPGHPVIFSSRARAGIARLAAGTPINALRDREDLTRLVLHIEQPWPYRDVDYEADARDL